MYGRSPDSDDGAELTGRHLMQQFSQQFSQERQPDGGSAPDSPPAAASSKKAAAVGSGADVYVQAGSLPPQPASAAAAAPAAGPGGGGSAAAASPGAREHRHTTEHAGEAYSLPEHAQAAALLGQPVYDLSLSSALPAVPAEPVPSSAKPHRTPFMSDLLHHSHPPGPQELLQGVGSAGPATRAGSEPLPSPGSGAQSASLAEALAQLPGMSPASAGSCAAHWLSDEEEDDAWRQQGAERSEGGFGGGGRSVCGIPAAVYRSLPFSVRNAPLLRVIPKYCESSVWCADASVLYVPVCMPESSSASASRPAHVRPGLVCRSAAHRPPPRRPPARRNPRATRRRRA